MNRIKKEKKIVNTFGDFKTKRALLGKVDLISRYHDSKTFLITALCTDYICLSVKNQLITQCSFTQTNRVWSWQEIYILVELNLYWELVTGKVKVGNLGEPVGVETKFGWGLNRPISHHQRDLYRANVVSCTTVHTMLRTDCCNEKYFELNEHKVAKF